MTLPSLTRDEAATRSALLDVQRYAIAVDLTDLLEGEVFSSVSTVTFTCNDFELKDAELAIRTLARQVAGDESIHSCLIPPT